MPSPAPGGGPVVPGGIDATVNHRPSRTRPVRPAPLAITLSLVVAFSVAVAACGSPASSTTPAPTSSGSPNVVSTPSVAAPSVGAAATPSPAGRLSCRPGRAFHRPPRPRLDSEHQPPRLLRGAGQGLVRGRGHRPGHPPVRRHGTRGDPRRSPGGVRDQLPGLDDVRGCRRGAHRLGHGDPPAHGTGHRGAGGLGYHAAQAAGRQDLRGLRIPERGADPPGRHPCRWRDRDVQHGDAGHRGLRGAVLEARRLRHHLRGLGGDRGGPARRRPAHVPLHRLRVPGLLPGGPRL